MAAGLVFSLLAIKIHWFLLLPIPLVMRRQWRVIGGLAAGGAILLCMSFAVAGPDWIPRWWRSMIADPMANFKPAIMPTLHGVVDGLPGAGILEAVLSVAVVIAACLVARRARFEISIAAAILGGFLISRPRVCARLRDPNSGAGCDRHRDGQGPSFAPAEVRYPLAGDHAVDAVSLLLAGAAASFKRRRHGGRADRRDAVRVGGCRHERAFNPAVTGGAVPRQVTVGIRPDYRRVVARQARHRRTAPPVTAGLNPAYLGSTAPSAHPVFPARNESRRATAPG